MKAIQASFRRQSFLADRLVATRAKLKSTLRFFFETLTSLKSEQENALWLLRYERADLAQKRRMRAAKKASATKRQKREADLKVFLDAVGL